MLSKEDWLRLLDDLEEPFAPELIQWRPGATSKDKTKAQALPYVDPRDYERRLDDAAPGSWDVVFEPWGETRLICKLTIHGVTRSSTGESADEDKAISIGTSAEAQAFKRACSRFGLGRHFYDYHNQWVAYDKDRRKLLERPAYKPKFRPKRSTTSPEHSQQEVKSYLIPQQAPKREATTEAPNKQSNLPPFEPSTRPRTLTEDEAKRLEAAIAKSYKDWIDPSEYLSIASKAVNRDVKSFMELRHGEGNAVVQQARARAAELASNSTPQS